MVRISAIGAHEGAVVTIKGWLYKKRSSGKIVFLQIRDGSGTIQAVAVKSELPGEAFEKALKATQESSLVVTGSVRQDARAPGGYEMTVTDVELIQVAEDYPITPKEHGVDFLMDNRHLWLRSSKQQAIMRIRNEIVRACEDYLQGDGFIRIDTPILTPAACEGTTTLFETDYFDKKAYLSQSGQLYNEANCMAFGKVYCYGPTFRAEKSKTRRHLMEFWMLEPEMAYADLDEDMRVEEEMLSYVVARVLERRRQDLETLERNTSALENVKAPFPRVHYEEAIKLLKSEGVELPWGEDLGAEHETVLSKKFDRPFFVHRYPVKCKAFYMKPDPGRPDLALCVDMLAPEGYGEITGGGQRIDDYGLLRQRIEEHGLPIEAYQWYLDLRKYGSVPHSGFGIGIERTITWICGLEHLRESIPYPRMLSRLYP
ncbi:MAG: asparagine--tRNA ligase [Candidatus Eremiobacteraeota bacterium]|nr:asparagine--tRNA ligase [Candidatus Eremiobacteraeota bacterium]